ncbi:hypothetical protein L6452_25000 [Arctium lappa]|uniref:Uncharacterized protein n=1 Tax=Arctium lappa TaxID=4217 RepID=A0ACB9AAP8_ARCLA|nr:hypothetical protein L6452_25000 [Arctium lappa]
MGLKQSVPICLLRACWVLLRLISSLFHSVMTYLKIIFVCRDSLCTNNKFSMFCLSFHNLMLVLNSASNGFKG